MTAPARVCSVPGCGRPLRAKSLCYKHYQATWAANQTLAAHIGTPLAIFPRHPKRIREALHALAETPGLTLAEYEKRREAIEKGHQT